MRRIVLLTLFSALAVSAPAGDQKSAEPLFKNIEVKHFPLAEGVELPPEFSDLLYAEIRKSLQKTGLYEQVTGEGEVLEAADAPKSLILDGKIVEYKKGNVAKEVLIGLGAGRRSLRAQITVRRVSDQQVVMDKELNVKASSRWTPQVLAKSLADKVAGELKKALRR